MPQIKQATKDKTMEDLSSSLKKLGIKIYMTYGNDSGLPSVHMITSSIKHGALVKLVNCIGMYNFIAPKQKVILRPHNYGDFESYLSLERATTRGKKDLKAFTDFLKGSLKICES